MLLGMKSAPATIQSMINNVMKYFDCCNAYIVDITEWSGTLEEHKHVFTIFFYHNHIWALTFANVDCKRHTVSQCQVHLSGLHFDALPNFLLLQIRNIWLDVIISFFKFNYCWIGE